MAISKSIVEMIYSRDPPGRFLKKCPDTEKWVELSLKEAATRTSQAMAYTVREMAKHKKKRRSLRLLRDRGASAESSTEYNASVENENTGTVSVPSTGAASALILGGELDDGANSTSRLNDASELSGAANNRMSAPAASLQQQILQLQLQQLCASSIPSATTSSANTGAPLNGLILLLAQAQLQQQQQQQAQLQQQLLLRQLLGQLPSSQLTQRSMLQNKNNSGAKLQAPALFQNSTTLMESLRQSNLVQNPFPSHQSGPINTQALLSLMTMLQSQPSITPPQFPWLTQQLNQVQQNLPHQAQNIQQLLAPLLTRTNPFVLLSPPQQQQPLNMLQQQANLLQHQISASASNSASNPGASTDDEPSSSIARARESDEDNEASDE